MVEGRLAGRTALVTGGASGFGEGIVRRFLKEGATVAIVDRDGDKATALARELGSSAIAVHADVSHEASVAQMSGTILERFPRLDILVNNAGIGHRPIPLDELDPGIFDELLAVNVRSVFLTARAFVPAMKRAGGGAILNVASTGGIRPRPGLAWYNASKGWMIAATRAMAIELAAFRIRVNAINPVAGETPLLATFMGEDTPEARARMVASIPLGRLSLPADMGAAAAYLCSDDAAMVTGVALEVDGGRCL
ncbi:MAG TPA: glucose 1-dehydrogenase [Steroidobacteraceae bacterium]|nr:glucose 1-dehydrogenase [Steroidobacteraceae bacterium]